MRTAICRADIFSTRYFCLSHSSFRYSGLVQILEISFKFIEDAVFVLGENWSSRDSISNPDEFIAETDDESGGDVT